MTRPVLGALAACLFVFAVGCSSPGGGGVVLVDSGDTPDLSDATSDVAGEMAEDAVADAAPDADAADAAADATTDADAAADAEQDAQNDATDAAVDVSADADADADAEADAAMDTVEDAAADAASDAAPDAAPDTSPTCTPGVLRCDEQTIQACVVGGIWQSITTCPAAQPCVDGACCTPNCSGKDCGSDGCGGSCGACSTGLTCVGGECTCIGSCKDKTCGDDGCGNACGACAATEACVDFACKCKPVCGGKTCGPDACGGSCGTCKFGEQCTGGACICTPKCDGKACGPDGCGGSCGVCPGKQDSCEAGVCECIPLCGAKECGPDGCGGACGACASEELCNNGVCVPDTAEATVASFGATDTPTSLGWASKGQVKVVAQLNEIKPAAGDAMLLVATEQLDGSQNPGSSATVDVTLAKGVSRVIFSALFVSSEWVTWCSTSFVDEWLFSVSGGAVDRAIWVTINDMCPPPAAPAACATSTPPCDFTCLDTPTGCGWASETSSCTGSYGCATGRFLHPPHESTIEFTDGPAMVTDWLDLAIEFGAPLLASQPVKIRIDSNNVGDNAYDSLLLIDSIRTE